MDYYKKFGLITLLISLFFMFVIASGSASILFISGILYSLVLFFHSPLEQFFSTHTTHPVRAYAIGVVVNGLIVEVLAYTSSLDQIQAGQHAFLFATSSLFSDLLMGLPYYLTFAWIFAWVVRKYDFTPLSLGLAIFIGQAMTVDIFSHLVQLFSGNILGFLQAGLLMLFTLHASIILFYPKIHEQYQNRSRSWLRYPIVMVLQLAPLAVTLIFAFVRYNILGL